MGTSYRYVCTTCDYSAIVSGGPDAGWIVKTQTGICRQCDQLVDVITELREPGVSPLGMSEVTIGGCPNCRANVTEFWNDGDACPRCGGAFGPRLGVMDWD